MDFVNYQLSFGLDTSGRRICSKTADTFSVLLFLYRFFFLGQKGKEGD
jgi:hypothetical protein